MAEYQQNKAPKGESQELENKNLICEHNGPHLAHVPSIHGFYPFHGSIAFYLMKNPMSLDELMRRQHRPGNLWYNIDSSFNRLKIKSKDWHQTTTSDLRIKMMYKVCEGIFPRTCVEANSYAKSHIMAANARVFEGEAYAMANSISEYFYMLDDKIEIIQKRQEQQLAEEKQWQEKQQERMKNFMANPFLMTVNSWNSKGPGMQSSPNESISKMFVDQQQMLASLDNVSMKKQLCDEKDSDNLELLDSGKDSGNSESPESGKDSGNLESPESGKDSDNLESPKSGKNSDNLKSLNDEETGKIKLHKYKTITPDLRVPKTKKWHQQVKLRMRMRIIHKILETFFPIFGARYWFDVGSSNIYAFVRKVEADIYEMADSEPEYYQLLAEKIYELQNNQKEQQLSLSACGSYQESPLMRLNSRLNRYRSVQMASYHEEQAECNVPPPAPELYRESPLKRLKSKLNSYRSVQAASFHAEQAEGNAPPPATGTVPAPAFKRA